MKKTICCSAKLNTLVDLKCFNGMDCPWAPPHHKNLSWALGSLPSWHLRSGLFHSAATDIPYAQKEREGSGLAEDGAGQGFFLLMKQQNDLVLPEVMIAVSQKGNWCQKVNHQTFCTLASHTLKIQLCVLVHAPHIAIATVKPINLM